MTKRADRSLEDRIRAIEDRLEIYDLIASHPPSADTGGNDHIAASWVEDGVFDRGEEPLEPARARRHRQPGSEPRNTRRRSRAGWPTSPGCRMSRSMATLRSSRPICRSWCRRREGDPVEVPNHGSSKGFRVHRMTANRWELVRTRARLEDQAPHAAPARRLGAGAQDSAWSDCKVGEGRRRVNKPLGQILLARAPRTSISPHRGPSGRGDHVPGLSTASIQSHMVCTPMVTLSTWQ